MKFVRCCSAIDLCAGFNFVSELIRHCTNQALESAEIRLGIVVQPAVVAAFEGRPNYFTLRARVEVLENHCVVPGLLPAGIDSVAVLLSGRLLIGRFEGLEEAWRTTGEGKAVFGMRPDRQCVHPMFAIDMATKENRIGGIQFV